MCYHEKKSPWAHGLFHYPSGRREAYAVPTGVEKIGNAAFSGARGLTEVTLSAGVTEIGWDAFSGCDGLKNIVFPEDMTGLETIGESAFYLCDALTEAVLPDGLETIGGSAFAGCRSLKKAVLPGSLTSFGESSFSGCRSLTDLTLGEGISRIENQTVGGCSRLRRLMLPKSLTYIGSDVFTSAKEADIHFAGTEAEWKAVRLGYNALPEGLRVRCESVGPVEPDLDEANRNGWPSYDWENKRAVWDFSLTINNGGKAGDIAVQAVLYDENSRFLGLRQQTLTLEQGKKTYKLSLSFPGVDRVTAAKNKVFRTDAAASPLYGRL